MSAPRLSEFFAAWEFFREPALTGLLAGAVLGLLGVYIVLRRMVFLSAAMSQCAGLGVTLAFFIQIHLGVAAAIASPTAGALALTLLAGIVVFSDRSSGGGRRDALLGILFVAGSAGTLALGTRIVQEIQDVQTILFGTAVAVMPEDFRMAATLALILLPLHLWWMRGFMQASFDAEGARVRNLPVGLLDGILLLSLAIAISVFTRIIGALPVFAFTVLPAFAAIRVSPSVRTALVTAMVLGSVTGFSGYVLAWRHDLPVGAAQALVGLALVAIAEILRQGLRLLGRGRHSNGRQDGPA